MLVLRRSVSQEGKYIQGGFFAGLTSVCGYIKILSSKPEVGI